MESVRDCLVQSNDRPASVAAEGTNLSSSAVAAVIAFATGRSLLTPASDFF